MKLPNLKLINAIVFFLIIGATQYLVSSEKTVTFEQHVQVQQELSQLIASYIKENLPGMIDFKMHSVYTKAPKKGLMEAYFNYSFTTPIQDGAQLATTELSGIAVLKKIKDTPNQEWALEQLNVEGEVLTFTEPIVITSEKKNAADEDGFVPVQPEDDAPVAPKKVQPKPITPPAPQKTEPAETPNQEDSAESSQLQEGSCSD
jgi:hypothetical protein